MDGKILSPNKRIGQLGVNLIERIVLRMGFKLQQMNAELDTGIDGIIEICDPETGKALNCILLFQSRARKQFVAETETTFEYVCEEGELKYWLAGNVPVLLIVSRSDSDDEAYWIEVKSYFGDPQRLASRRVQFNKQRDRFSQAAADALKQLAIPRDRGIYFPPPPRAEKLTSNLFRIKDYGRRLYIGFTEARFPGAIWGKAREEGLPLPGGEWFLKSGQLVSFHDLKEYPWPKFVDVGTVHDFETDEWALSNDPDRQREFAWMMRLCLKERLRRWGIGYDDRLELYYFWATANRKPMNVLLPGSVKPKTVFTPYQSKVTEGKVSFFRHQAFYADFLRIDDDWYLAVTPTYHFTRDGRQQSRFAGELARGIKKLERNAAVFGHLRLWEFVLTNDCPPSEALWTQSRSYPFLTFDPAERVECPHGFDDQVWLKKEEKDTAAKLIAQDDAGLFEKR